ncbi:MAG: DUF2785 domain-containing protein [Aquisalinus sp.]|nr:DUF2785 domain-containing protein [Aquisalinus sp.]
MKKSALMDLRKSGFELEQPDNYKLFAEGLVDCLGHPDPDLRDQVGFEGLSTLMRENRLKANEIVSIGANLIEKLNDPDPNGFTHPFVALALAEVARADRIDKILTADQRATLVTEAANYIATVKDYRGFDERDGWRHGVAHGADLLMQLSLNEALNKEQLLILRDAISKQIIPSESHFYIYGESERLARPILFMARRGLISEEEWTQWFTDISDPAPFENWGDVFFSQEGLARRHNLRAFALSVYANADASSNDAYKVLLPGALATLAATN